MVALLCGKMKTVFQFFTPTWEQVSVFYTHMGANKKYKAHISKYV